MSPSCPVAHVAQPPMLHLTDDQLVLLHYGELPDDSGARAHLAACAACRASLRELTEVLRLVDVDAAPVRDATYGGTVWQDIAPRLDHSPPSWGLSWWVSAWRDRWTRVQDVSRWLWPQTGLATAVAALLIAMAVWPASRESSRSTASRESRGSTESRESKEARELGERPSVDSFDSVDPFVSFDSADVDRVLVSAVTDHLERAGMMLTELNQAQTSADVAELREWADDLTVANRLYRQSARFSGEERLERVLDELERVLLEVVHVGEDMHADAADALRERLDTRGEAFKLRVTGAELRGRLVRES
jgi:hypothetical protein